MPLVTGPKLASAPSLRAVRLSASSMRPENGVGAAPSMRLAVA